MTISFAATNPCHLYPLAREVARAGKLGTYYSGYPRWKLRPGDEMKVRTHSLRTNVVYGLLRFAPGRMRPSSRRLFLWQDHGFDRWTGKRLDACNFIHAMPGQCRETFRAARRRSIRTVLNHATGPVRDWVRIMEPEYRRVGLRLEEVCPYDELYFNREDEEYALSDWHCVASSVVRDQLVAQGIDASRIWQVPYGAEPEIFHPKGMPAAGTAASIAFAGQVGLRKGLKTLLDALARCGGKPWRMDFYGAVLDEAQHDLSKYGGEIPLHFHGAVSQRALADAFRKATVLVLPSLEEGFGLVVPQALACGLPCVVSDRTGAKDLIRQGENGSIFPVQNAEALAEELHQWVENPRRVQETLDWSMPARTLVTLSEAASS